MEPGFNLLQLNRRRLIILIVLGIVSISAGVALVILTAVDKVAINYRQPSQRDLDRLTVDQAREYITQGHFAPGSMLPKVESCIDFVAQSQGGVALITSLDKAREALRGTTGTLITP